MTEVGAPSRTLHPTDPALAGRVIAGCRLQTLLGSGGMGAVWKAHHLALDVSVAVKLLLPLKELDASGAERLLREARAAARLRHPNIVGVLNVGQEEGLPFLVMEFVEGESLQQRLEARGKLPLGEAVGILKQVLAALELTFEHRIIHRDIKPDNLLVDRQGRVRLVDLGLAKQMDGGLELTQTGAVMGSPYYIAPEQAANSKAADGRADIYALGCTFFHLLVGAPPYGGATYLEIILKHIQGPVAGLSALDASIPMPVVEIAARMMAKDPARRYQTPTEILADLATWQAGQMGKAQGLHPDGDRWGRRRLLPLAIVAVLALLVPLTWLAMGKGDRVKSDSLTTAPVVEQTRPPPSGIAPALVEKPKLEKQILAKPARPRATTRPSPGRTESPRARGGNALMDSLSTRDTEGLRKLLDRGASPNVSSGGLAPIHYAVMIGDSRAVRMLLEKGANPNAQDLSGETALLLAMQRGYRDMVGDLLDFGANPNVRDRAGRTPLELAVGDPYFTRKLTEKGAH